MRITTGLAVLGLSAVMMMGCANNQAGDETNQAAGIYNEDVNHLHVNNHEPDFYNPEIAKNEKGFGYVRHKRADVAGAAEQPHYTINREQLANTISRLSTQVNGVDDVSTLVTDEEVLIVYENNSENRADTAMQVKRMAESVVPGWFHIFVSDNTNLRQNIKNFATLNTHSRDIDELIDGVIRQMRTSPQGNETMNTKSENE